MILGAEDFTAPLEACCAESTPWSEKVSAAVVGLQRVVKAAELPFRLVQDAVAQRYFDKTLAAESIRRLTPEELTLSDDSRRLAYASAEKRAAEFFSSLDGQNYMRDSVVYDLNARLSSENIRVASEELLVQTLISTWSIFEHFARNFIIDWVNENPASATPLLAASDLKEFFGKQTIDIQTITEHSFDLSSSMGFILFGSRRLDSLKVIKCILKSLFNCSKLQIALGGDLRLLNNKRHLFVHNRGIIDREYIERSGDTLSIGSKLIVNCEDIEKYLVAVRSSIVCISGAAAEHRVRNAGFSS